MKRLIALMGCTLALGGLIGCSVNPVTGKNQFSLVSAEDEVSIGSQNYGPSQQSQGGRYVVDPELNVYVNQVGQKLAAVSDRPQLPYEFVVLNNGVPNAWALPGGKLAINRGLLVELKDESQLAAVLGHEITHAAARHGALQQTQNILVNTGVMVAGVAAATQDSEYAGLAVGAVGVGANAWMSKYSRSHELESDRYGIEYMIRAGYDPMGAVELQETFVKLSEGRQSNWLDGLFASHPPSQERVAANRIMAQAHPGGVRNKAAFERATAQLRKDQAAYAQYDKALAAASNKKYADAMSLVESAIKKQPKENLFWELKGKLLLQEDKKDEAIDALTKAVQANPEYVVPYVYRGIAYQQSGKNAQAEKDLITAQQLLPTQLATYYLGEVSLAQGKRNEAAKYFQQAAQGGGELGNAAKSKLASLGIQ